MNQKNNDSKVLKATNQLKENEDQKLIKVDRLFESLRNAEYSFDSGIGEIIDNSIQAGSSKIWVSIETKNQELLGSKKNKSVDVISEVVITDNGEGMTDNVLQKCLVLGETYRPVPKGGKLGIGKFGVGLTLGGISLARRIEVYTRRNKDMGFKYTYIDLDEIKDKSQIYVPIPTLREPPKKYNDYSVNSTGTIVILKKCDRLQYDMVNGKSIKASEHIMGVSHFLGRTFRKFIYGGVEIKLNNEKVYLHDPLYLLGPTKFDSKESNDPKAEIKGEETIELTIPNTANEKAKIAIKMSLLPVEWRMSQGDGGSPDARKRKIPENEGISILRAGREVLYGKVPYIIGKRGTASFDRIDRFWGCEISFPPELDEYFHVRYIKRGAEPISSLRDKIREIIAPVVESLRKEIRTNMKKTKAEKGNKSGIFDTAEDVMQKASDVLPKGKRGTDLNAEEEDEKINQIANDAIISGQDENDHEKAREEKKEEIRSKPYKIEPVSYPQNIFFETEHILGRVIIKLNVNHPFYQKIFVPLCGDIDNKEVDADIENIVEKQRIRDAIMLLLLSYGKSESMFENQDDFLANLRSQWGSTLGTAINKMGE